MTTPSMNNSKALAFGILSILALLIVLGLTLQIIPAGAQEGDRQEPAEAPPYGETLLQEAKQRDSANIETDVAVSSDGPGQLVIPATEFRRTFYYGTGAGRFLNGYLQNGQEDFTNEWIAPVRLPDGARIQKMTAFIYDNDASYVDVWMLRKDYTSTDIYFIPAYVGSSLASENTQVRPFSTTLGIREIVDNDPYQYYILVRLYSTNHRLYAVNIDFSIDVNLPLLTNNWCANNPSGRETEPNDTRAQANPICIDSPVKGDPNEAFPDAELDYFAVEWNAQGTLQVDLIDFVSDAQLILYKEGIEAYVARDFEAGPGNSFQVTYNGAAGPGTYYILALAGESRADNLPDYTLTATIK